MRGLKLTVILSLLLATSAFGATKLKINGLDTPQVRPDGSLNYVLTLTMDNPTGFMLAGYGLKVTGAPAGQVTLVTRANNQVGVLTDATSAQSAVQNKDIGALINTVDLGYSGDFDTTEVGGASVPLQTLTLRLAAGVTTPPATPISFQLKATNLNFGSELSVASATLVPEPASMMLLAAGAAFFARRRRVA